MEDVIIPLSVLDVRAVPLDVLAALPDADRAVAGLLDGLEETSTIQARQFSSAI